MGLSSLRNSEKEDFCFGYFLFPFTGDCRTVGICLDRSLQFDGICIARFRRTGAFVASTGPRLLWVPSLCSMRSEQECDSFFLQAKINMYCFYCDRNSHPLFIFSLKKKFLCFYILLFLFYIYQHFLVLVDLNLLLSGCLIVVAIPKALRSLRKVGRRLLDCSCLRVGRQASSLFLFKVIFFENQRRVPEILFSYHLVLARTHDHIFHLIVVETVDSWLPPPESLVRLSVLIKLLRQLIAPGAYEFLVIKHLLLLFDDQLFTLLRNWGYLFFHKT